jgi:hypothetical protein
MQHKTDLSSTQIFEDTSYEYGCFWLIDDIIADVEVESSSACMCICQSTLLRSFLWSSSLQSYTDVLIAAYRNRLRTTC